MTFSRKTIVLSRFVEGQLYFLKVYTKWQDVYQIRKRFTDLKEQFLTMSVEDRRMLAEKRRIKGSDRQ